MLCAEARPDFSKRLPGRVAFQMRPLGTTTHPQTRETARRDVA